MPFNFTTVQFFSFLFTIFQSVTLGQILGDRGITSFQLGLLSAISISLMIFSIWLAGNIIDRKSSTFVFTKIQVILFIYCFLPLIILFYADTLVNWCILNIIGSVIAGFELSSRQQFVYDNIATLNPNSKNAVYYDVLINNASKIFGYLSSTLFLSNISNNLLFIPFTLNIISYGLMLIYLKKVNLFKISYITRRPKKHYSNLKIFGFIMKHRDFKRLLIIETVAAILFYGINTQAYLFTRYLNTELHFGWFLVLGATGSFLANTWLSKYSFKTSKKIAGAFFIIGTMSLSFASYYKYTYISLMGATLIVMGCSYITAVTRNTLHGLTENKRSNKGKIFSVYMIMYSINTALGALVAGYIIQKYSFVAYHALLFVSFSIFLIFSNTDISVKIPRLRRNNHGTN